MKSSFLHSVKGLVCILTLSLLAIKGIAQPCTPTYFQGCAFGNQIEDFILNGEAGTSISDLTTGCTMTTGSGFPPTNICWRDMTGIMSVTLMQGLNYPVQVSDLLTAPPVPPLAASNLQIWIDFDGDNTFTSAESVGGGGPLPYPSTLSTFTITIPPTAALGTHRMRVEVNAQFSYPSINPCPDGSFPSGPDLHGEVHDYDVIIIASGPVCTVPAPTIGAATCSTQVINWAAVTGATGYEWIVNTTAGAPGGSGTATAALTATATSLTAATAYYAHVRTNCGTGFSAWVNIPFTTPGPTAITGTTALCPLSTTQLSDGVGGGVWSSSNSSFATIDAGGLVHGTAAGTTNISYTVGGCSVGVAVTVGILPALTGVTSVCPGSTTQLSDAVPGGTWISGTPSVATVSGTGLVYGTIAGTTVITYTASGCSTTTTVTVSTLPPITGGNSVCIGLTLALSNATSGGVWSSLNSSMATVSATGVVTGGAVGTATIRYTLGGCFVSATVTVGAAIAPITGTTTFCVTGSTNLSDATPGGTWSSGTVSVATVSGTVVVHGASAGTTTISYTIGTCSATAVVNVESNSAGTITGTDSVCVGPGHAQQFSDNVTGGVWSSTNSSRATIDPTTGLATGVATGIDTIKYTVTNTCGTFSTKKWIYVRNISYCITGIDPLAANAPTELKVFPNPNGGEFTVSLLSAIDEDAHIVVMNIVGEKIREYNTKTNKAIDIQLNTAAGMYLISVSTPHGRYITKVLVQK